MSETRFYPVVTNNTDSIEKLDGQIIFDIDNKSISIDIDNSRFAVQSVDSELSEISKNPVQNKVIAEKLFDLEEKVSKIEAPSTWLTGTSGSATLPRAGLYEVKATTAFGLTHAMLYWDGSSTSIASFGAIAGLPAIIVSSTGVITTVDPNDLTTPIELTLKYRKIRIA